MAHWERVQVPPDFAGANRAERQSGTYLRYHPDLLAGSSTSLDASVVEYAADVTTSLVRLGSRLRANPLPILFSTTIRSESISSSWIEGIHETPRSVALAQIDESAASHSATQIVRNVAAMQEGIALLGAGAWTHEAIGRIHQDLLPWHRPGYRAGQVWIGDSNKFNAEYVAPPGTSVPDYMDDLLAYANTSGDLPVVQAAIIHAQFETIHPFEDGNGRVGRALVHGVLNRSGLIEGGVIPLSSAFRADERGYVAALTSYRHDGADRTPALNSYVGQFLAYVETATAAGERFVNAATEIHSRWRATVEGIRVDSSLHRAVDLVAEHPVVSARFLADHLGVSKVAAHDLVKKLEAARILKPATGKYRRSELYQADDILELLASGGSPPSDDAPASLIHRCGDATARGPCRNRVPVAGQLCWRHRAR